MRSRPPVRSLACCRSGTAAIEFALIGLLVISLLLGTFEFGRALFLRNQLAFAADVATRHVLLTPPESSADLDQLRAEIQDALTVGQGDAEILLDLPSSGGVLLITIRQPLQLLVPHLFEKRFTLSIDRRIPLPYPLP